MALVPSVCVLLACMILSSCAMHAVQNINLPSAFEQEGVQVNVQELDVTRNWHTLTGTAQNVSGKDYSALIIRFDALDAEGVKVGGATAVTHGLKAGQIWRFEAIITASDKREVHEILSGELPYTSIQVGKVTVVRPMDEFIADLQAQKAARANQVQAPNQRLIGIKFSQQLPNGAYLPRITQLTAGGLAEQADWQVGDLILSVDGVAIRTVTDLVIATQRGSKNKVYELQRGEGVVESTLIFQK